jgi:microcystin-dependent protein
VATVTGFTAARSQQIEDGTVIGGLVNGSGDLILTKHDASTVNAGHVVGPAGPLGPGFSAGMITPFAGDAAAVPSGWLVCDGSSQLRSAYAALFAVIGVIYGSVDGTHFNLPNLVARFPRGVASGPGGTWDQAIHHHSLSDAGAAAILISASTPSIYQRRVNMSWNSTHSIATSPVAGGGAAAQTIGTGLVGNSDDATSLPPYLSLLYLIKT